MLSKAVERSNIKKEDLKRQVIEVINPQSTVLKTFLFFCYDIYFFLNTLIKSELQKKNKKIFVKYFIHFY